LGSCGGGIATGCAQALAVNAINGTRKMARMLPPDGLIPALGSA
jgi:hypothetical protein